MKTNPHQNLLNDVMDCLANQCLREDFRDDSINAHIVLTRLEAFLADVEQTLISNDIALSKYASRQLLHVATTKGE